jgi:nitrite reductase/ring-hydroxylating ferredoxin subunit
MTNRWLCALTNIPDPGSAGFEIKVGDHTMRLMVIRQGAEAHIYENSCPHRRLPLDFKPGQFLDAEHKFILCTNHIALFQIENGTCIEGPCKGASLNKFNATVRDDGVFVTL